MRNLIILTGLAFSFHSFAGLTDFFNSDKAHGLCELGRQYNPQTQMYKTYLKMVRSDDSTSAFVYKDRSTSLVKLVDLATYRVQELNLNNVVKDIVFKNDKIYILTTNELILIERHSGYELNRVRTLPTQLSYGKDRVALGLTLTNDSLFIAHGIYGVVELDAKTLKSKRIINPSVPQPNDAHVSMVTDVVYKEGKIYFTLDNVTMGPGRDERAFEGLVIYDVVKNKMVKTIPVNQKQEAYHMSTLTMLSNELVISNLHLNFRHKISKLMKSRYMKPDQRIWKYPLGTLIGHPYITEGSIYGCFSNYQTDELRAGKFSF